MVLFAGNKQIIYTRHNARIISKLESKEIQTRTIWDLIHEQQPYKKYEAYNIEKALCYCGCILNIPTSTNITDSEIEYVNETIKDLLKGLTDG